MPFVGGYDPRKVQQDKVSVDPNQSFLSGTVQKALNEAGGGAPSGVRPREQVPNATVPQQKSQFSTYNYQNPGGAPGSYSTLKGGGAGNTDYQNWATANGMAPTWNHRQTLPGGVLVPQMEQLRQTTQNDPLYGSLSNYYKGVSGWSDKGVEQYMMQGQKKGLARASFDPNNPTAGTPDYMKTEAYRNSVLDIARQMGVDPNTVAFSGGDRMGIKQQGGQSIDADDLVKMAEQSYQNRMKEQAPGIYGNRDAFERAPAEAWGMQAAQGAPVSFGHNWINKSGQVTDEGKGALMSGVLNYTPDVTYNGPSSQLEGAFAGGQQGVANLAAMLQGQGGALQSTGGNMVSGGLDYLRNAANAASSSNQNMFQQLMQRQQSGNDYLSALGRQQADALGQQTLAGIVSGGGGYNPAAAAAAANMGSEGYKNIMNQLGTQALQQQDQMAKLGLDINKQSTDAAAALAQASNQGAGQLGTLFTAASNPLLNLSAQNLDVINQGMNSNLQRSSQDFNAQQAIANLIRQGLLDKWQVGVESQKQKSSVQRSMDNIGQALALPGQVVGGVVGAAKSIYS